MLVIMPFIISFLICHVPVNRFPWLLRQSRKSHRVSCNINNLTTDLYFLHLHWFFLTMETLANIKIFQSCIFTSIVHLSYICLSTIYILSTHTLSCMCLSVCLIYYRFYEVRSNNMNIYFLIKTRSLRMLLIPDMLPLAQKVNSRDF